MNNCGTCTHRVTSGECSHPKLQESYGKLTPEDNDALVYSYNEGGTFWVGPNFGCVHWATKGNPQ